MDKTRAAAVRRPALMAIMAWVCIVMSLFPVVITVVAATTATWNAGGPYAGGFTLQWLGAALPDFLPALNNSIQVAVSTLVLDLVLGIPLSYLLARRRWPWLAVINWMASLPLSVPGMALGLSLVAVYPMLAGSTVLVVIGHVLLTLPFLIAALVPVLRDESLLELENVSRTLTPSWLRTFATVTLPHVRTALLGGALMILTLSLGEFNITYFVLSPATPTMPVAMFSEFIYGNTSSSASQAVLYCLAVIPAAVLLQFFGSKMVKRQS